MTHAEHRLMAHYFLTRPSLPIETTPFVASDGVSRLPRADGAEALFRMPTAKQSEETKDSKDNSLVCEQPGTHFARLVVIDDCGRQRAQSRECAGGRAQGP